MGYFFVHLRARDGDHRGNREHLLSRSSPTNMGALFRCWFSNYKHCYPLLFSSNGTHLRKIIGEKWNMITEENFDEADKYRQRGIYIFLGLFFFLTYRLTVFITWWPFTTPETFIYIAVGFIIVYISYVKPLQEREKANKRAMGIDFLEGKIVTTLDKREDFFLGIKKYIKIDIDFEDDKSLKDLKESKYYKKLKREFLRIEQGKNFGERSVPDEIDENFLKKLQKEYAELEKKARLKKEAKEDLTSEEQAELEKKAELIEATKEAMLPFKKFDISLIKDADKKKLKALHVYYLEMYEEEFFEGSETGFDRLFIVLHDKATKLLQTRPGTGWHKGWEIDLRCCQVYWICFGFAQNNMPMLYLKFSENMLEEDVKMFSDVRAEAMTYFIVKILHRWIDILSTVPEQALQEIERQKARANMFEIQYNDTIQEMAKDNLIYSQFIEDKKMNDLVREKEKYKQRSQIEYIIMLALFFIFMIIIFSILTAPTSTSTTFGKEPTYQAGIIIKSITSFKFK